MDRRKQPFWMCHGCKKKRVYIDAARRRTCSMECEIDYQRALDEQRGWQRSRAEIIAQEIDEAERLAEQVRKAMRRIKKNYSEFGDYAECAALITSLEQRTKELSQCN